MPGQQTKLPAAKWALREKDEEERKNAASATPALRARGRGGAADIPK